MSSSSEEHTSERLDSRLRGNDITGSYTGARRLLSTESTSPYAIINEGAKTALIGGFGEDASSGSNLTISSTYSKLSSGAGIVIPGFSEGGFGVGVHPNATFSLTASSPHQTITSFPLDDNSVIGAARLADGRYFLDTSQGDTGQAGIYDPNSGIYSSITLPTPIYIDGVLDIICIGTNCIFKNYFNTPTEEEMIKLRIINIDEQAEICSIDITSAQCVTPSGSVRAGYDAFLTSKTPEGKFIFVYNDISRNYTSNPVDCYTGTLPLYLYKMDPITCMVEREFLSGSGVKFGESVVTNGAIYAYGSSSWVSDETRQLELNFAGETITTSSFPIYAPLSYLLNMNKNGIVALQDNIIEVSSWYLAPFYLKIFNHEGLITEKYIYTAQSNDYIAYISFATPQWFEVSGRDYIAVSYFEDDSSKMSLITSVFSFDGASLELVRKLFETPYKPFGTGMLFPYSLGASNIISPESENSGLIRSFWLEIDSSSNTATLKTAVDIYTDDSVDVILGAGSSAGLLDCSSSAASKCYAVSQEADGDVLVGAVGEDNVLIGNVLGSKTFKLVPSASMPIGTASGGRRLLQSAENSSSNGTLEVWGMKYGDKFNLTELDFSEYGIEVRGNMTYVTGPGGVILAAVHTSPDSIPFNLTMAPGGVIDTSSSFVPKTDPIAPGGGGGSGGSSAPSIGHDDSGIGAGAVIGIIIGSLAALLGIGFLLYYFRDKIGFSKHGEAYEVSDESTPDDNMQVTINPLDGEKAVELGVIGSSLHAHVEG